MSPPTASTSPARPSSVPSSAVASENLIDPIVILNSNAVLLDASVQRIQQKLFFEYGGEQRPDALYSEMQPGGFLNVVPNQTGEESQLNIEALFNAVLRNKNTVKELFS